MRPRALSLFLLGAAAATVAAAHVHPSGCAHTHVPLAPQWHFCSTVGAACTPPASGTCQNVKSSIVASANWCNCVAPPGGGCLATAVSLLAADALPNENETVNYQVAFHPDNQSVVNFGTSAGIAAFDAKDDAVQAFLTLEFGESSDPTAIPVDLHALSLTYPSLDFGGLPTGAHTFQLPEGNTLEQPLIWDATTGILRPAEGLIQLEVANGLMSGGLVDIGFEGQFDSNGDLFGYAQISGPAPFPVVFLDGFELGDTSGWSATLGALLLIGGGFGVARGRRNRRR